MQAICPHAVMAFKRSGNGTPPTSPILRSSLQSDLANSTIRISSSMNLPSIATTCSSPASPNAKKSFVFQSPANTMRQTNLANSSLTASANSSTVSTLLSCTHREQPVATIRDSPTTTTAAAAVSACKSTRCKRNLRKGCGLLDWIRLCKAYKKELGGRFGEMRPITPAELALHDTEESAWTAVRGKVYDMTQYIRFHPGGKEELMKGAGIDCSILFDEVHNWVNVESQLKVFCLGPLVASSPSTMRRNSLRIKKDAAKLRKMSDTLAVPKTIMVTDGVNKQAVPLAIRNMDTLTGARKTSLELSTEAIAIRKTSLDLHIQSNTAGRKDSVAANACEEPDGIRQVSPDSPIRPLAGVAPPKKVSTASLEAAEGSSMRLHLPPTRIRRSSEPHPRFDWVQSEKAVTIHVATQNVNLKTSNIVIDVAERHFEASIFIQDWVYELDIDLAHAVVASQVEITCGRVEISLKKEVAHQQWEAIGTFLSGHNRLTSKARRDTKYHPTHVESIKAVTHNTKLFTLRLPAGSYLNVPTGHHLSVQADVNGEEVRRSYTPVSALEASKQRVGHSLAGKDGEVIELMVKLYNGGKMSGFLSNLKEGDKVMVSDPEGTFDAHTRLSHASDVLLVAAGSGFTPMVRVLHDFMASELVSRQRNTSASEARGEAGEEDQVAAELPPLTHDHCDYPGVVLNSTPKSARLLFANKKERDVMCMEELDYLRHATAGRFAITHILSDADKSWSGMRGRVDNSLLRASLPAISPENRQGALVCVCGPGPFTSTIINLLMEMDYPDECVHIFE